MEQRIMAAVEAELASKGLVKSDDHPDLLVITHLKLEKHDEVVAYGSGYPYGWWGYGYPYGWWGGWGVVDYRVYPVVVGTLSIELADPQHGTIWRGSQVKIVDTDDKPSTRDKNVRREVAKILKYYPPTRRYS
jgi:hypothetical protein